MKFELKCGSEGRRREVVNLNKLNGIDYLEIFTAKLDSASTTNRPLVLLYFFKAITPAELDKQSLFIEGGIRIKDIRIEWAQHAPEIVTAIKAKAPIIKDLLKDEIDTIIGAIGSNNTAIANVLIIRLNKVGDFSTYTLRLIRSEENLDLPPENFDSILSKIDFSFRVESQSNIDCFSKSGPPSGSFLLQEPVIDYMAKDFASFRTLMLDRLSATMPDWKERNPSDLSIALLELLSYVGDHLSYFQDAVATEAYLGTARRRISIKRHARLLDYYMHEAANARAWVSFDLKNRESLLIPKQTTLLTGHQGDDLVVDGIENFETQLRKGAEAFETMHDITLYKTHNQIEFYTWGDYECYLPKGATQAALIRRFS